MELASVDAATLEVAPVELGDPPRRRRGAPLHLLTPTVQMEYLNPNLALVTVEVGVAQDVGATVEAASNYPNLRAGGAWAARSHGMC